MSIPPQLIPNVGSLYVASSAQANAQLRQFSKRQSCLPGCLALGTKVCRSCRVIAHLHVDVTIRSSETVQDSYLTLGHIKWFYGTTCVVNQNAIVLKDQSKSVSTQQECSCETRGDTSLQLKVLPASHCPLKHLDPTLGAELPSCKALCVLIARVFHLHQPHQSLDCRFQCPTSHKGHTTSCGMDKVVSKSLRWQSWFTHSQSDRNGGPNCHETDRFPLIHDATRFSSQKFTPKHM